MTRKDSEKEAERPHYYSQFWLDVAAGRRVIGTPKTDEVGDVTEYEPSETVGLRTPARTSLAAASDGYEEEPHLQAAVEAPSPEEVTEPELEEMEVLSEDEDLELPNILVDEDEVELPAEAELPEMGYAPLEEEEEDLYEEEEEEEEEDDWGMARGRKKPKPGRQTKQPKKSKRERRGGY